MLGLVTHRHPDIYARMPPLRAPEQLSEQQITGQALRRLRRRAKLTQEQAASKADVVVQSWRRYEAGERDLSIEKIATLSQAIGFGWEDFTAERDAILGADSSSSDARTFLDGAVEPMMTVRDRVQAGAWLSADDAVQVHQTIAEGRDPRWPNSRQWLSLVVGDSVDRLKIFDGDFVKVVDAFSIGYSPRTGDILEVERTRFQGRERELSIKQVEVTQGGVLLWPRSTNARWTEPLDLRLGSDESDDTVQVVIRGLVVKTVRPMF
jgi:transcriptional regulator with XRE-family HTH domain